MEFECILVLFVLQVIPFDNGCNAQFHWGKSGHTQEIDQLKEILDELLREIETSPSAHIDHRMDQLSDRLSDWAVKVIIVL